MAVVEIVVLGAYFGLMAVLSLFGAHRYSLVYLYYRHRNRRQGPPESRFDKLPRITVQLPVYNERFVVRELLEAVCNLQYPQELLEIQVLDDSDDETRTILANAVREMQARGIPIEYIRRGSREGYKAGALQAGLGRAKGELIAVFDADFTPEPDFLQRMVHYFADPGVGAVQARWTFRNQSASMLTRMQAMLLDGHFVFEHGARSRSGRFFNFNGTAGMLRKTMIEDAGGWQHDTLTEDTDLSYRAQLRGWRFLYIPSIEAPSELPNDMVSFQIQQFRWAKGLIQTGVKLLPEIALSRRSMAIKVEAFFHLAANLAYPLMLTLAALILPSMLMRHVHLEGQLLWLDLPAFVLTFCSLSSFYTLAQRELKHGAAHGHLHRIPLLVAVGIGLTISNTCAVLDALWGRRSPFERTAKLSADRRLASESRLTYLPRAGWRAVANLVAAGYFGVCLGVALHIGHWLGLPVIGLFLFGFLYAGLSMVGRATNRYRATLRTADESAR